MMERGLTMSLTLSYVTVVSNEEKSYSVEKQYSSPKHKIIEACFSQNLKIAKLISLSGAVYSATHDTHLSDSCRSICSVIQVFLVAKTSRKEHNSPKRDCHHKIGLFPG